MGEIIYKKQFHREPIDETEPEVANFTDSGNAPSFDEIMKEIYSNVTYLVLPGREKKARNFIQIWAFWKASLRWLITSHFLTISAATIWSCPSTFIQRQYSKEDGLFSPNGQTWVSERHSGFVFGLKLQELEFFCKYAKEPVAAFECFRYNYDVFLYPRCISENKERWHEDKL